MSVSSAETFLSVCILLFVSSSRCRRAASFAAAVSSFPDQSPFTGDSFGVFLRDLFFGPVVWSRGEGDRMVRKAGGMDERAMEWDGRSEYLYLLIRLDPAVVVEKADFIEVFLHLLHLDANHLPKTFQVLDLSFKSLV